MSKTTTNLIAFFILLTTFLVGFFSYQEDSLTMDELAHIPAGYSYLSQQDFRINPEHPPLIKDLAALPLLSLDLNFPSKISAWQKGINKQWIFGNNFLFKSGNNADQIISRARFPMLCVLIILGWFIFWWTKKEFDNKTALITLTLFAFSPTFIAHGRLVTTDVGAVLGFAVATYFWLQFLKDPSNKNVISAGLAFGFAMLLKFSLALLVPFFGIITLFYIFVKEKDLWKYLSKSILIGLIGVVFVIWPVYQLHMINYPPARQARDTAGVLEPNLMNPLRNFLIFIADKPVIRSLGWYFTGLLKATQRTAFGNTTYFLGKLDNSAFRNYFPTVYLLKVPIALHILTLTSLGVLIYKKIQEKKCNIKQKIASHFTEFSMLVFLLIYWLTSILANLNLGIRHLLPVLPFTYILVSFWLVSFIKETRKPLLKKIMSSFILFCLVWYAASSLLNYPNYIAYYNEIVGTDNGYKYVVDSNYDWGQDLKRLVKWIEKNNIKEIKVDYFGGADVSYYLPEKAKKLNPYKGIQKGYIAVSTTLRQAGIGEPVPSFDFNGGYYRWLQDYEPVARAGKSILIYHIK